MRGFAILQPQHGLQRLDKGIAILLAGEPTNIFDDNDDDLPGLDSHPWPRRRRTSRL